MTTYFKRGSTESFDKASNVVHFFGEVLLNLDTWELFIADGKTPTCDLLPVGLLPETMRDTYRGLTK